MKDKLDPGSGSPDDQESFTSYPQQKRIPVASSSPLTQGVAPTSPIHSTVGSHSPSELWVSNFQTSSDKFKEQSEAVENQKQCQHSLD